MPSIHLSPLHCFGWSRGEGRRAASFTILACYLHSFNFMKLETRLTTQLASLPASQPVSRLGSDMILHSLTWHGHVAVSSNKCVIKHCLAVYLELKTWNSLRLCSEILKNSKSWPSKYPPTRNRLSRTSLFSFSEFSSFSSHCLPHAIFFIWRTPLQNRSLQNWLLPLFHFSTTQVCLLRYCSLGEKSFYSFSWCSLLFADSYCLYDFFCRNFIWDALLNNWEKFGTPELSYVGKECLKSLPRNQWPSKFMLWHLSDLSPLVPDHEYIVLLSFCCIFYINATYVFSVEVT